MSSLHDVFDDVFEQLGLDHKIVADAVGTLVAHVALMLIAKVDKKLSKPQRSVPTISDGTQSA